MDKVKTKDNVFFVLERNVVEILGDQKVKAVKLDKPFEGSDTISLQGVFIEIGAIPATEIPKALGCEVDEKGFLKVSANQQTTISGIFGAGDITNASNYFAQFATAAGEGSVAANSVFTHLSTAK